MHIKLGKCYFQCCYNFYSNLICDRFEIAGSFLKNRLLSTFYALLHSTQFALKIIATKKTQSFKTSWKMRLKLEKLYAQNYYNIYNKSVCGCFELT